MKKLLIMSAVGALAAGGTILTVATQANATSTPPRATIVPTTPTQPDSIDLDLTIPASGSTPGSKLELNVSSYSFESSIKTTNGHVKSVLGPISVTIPETSAGPQLFSRETEDKVYSQVRLMVSSEADFQTQTGYFTGTTFTLTNAVVTAIHHSGKVVVGDNATESAEPTEELTLTYQRLGQSYTAPPAQS